MIVHIDDREGTPPEAYGRVTNPERFRVLHEHAIQLLVRLTDTYDAVTTAEFDLPPGSTRPLEHARPPATVTPVSPAAAPIAIAFTPFPGLIVRYGRWQAETFPACGCDACDESAPAELERLDTLVHNVVAGLFVEEIRLPRFAFLGEARLYHRLGAASARAGPRSEGWKPLPRSVVRAFGRDAPRRVEWEPWARRQRAP